MHMHAYMTEYVSYTLLQYIIRTLSYTHSHGICIYILTSGILYTWYKTVHDGMYWYVPVRTLLGTWWYEKPQNGTYQYVPT